MHSTKITVEVNESMYMESFNKPLVAKYTKAFVGISFILAIFGVWALLRTRKREVTEDGSKPSGAP